PQRKRYPLQGCRASPLFVPAALNKQFLCTEKATIWAAGKKRETLATNFVSPLVLSLIGSLSDALNVHHQNNQALWRRRELTVGSVVNSERSHRRSAWRSSPFSLISPSSGQLRKSGLLGRRPLSSC